MGPDLPVPPHFDASRVGDVWKVDYEGIARAAREWARSRSIAPAERDSVRICLVAVDVQNTFCSPGYELYVAGRSGSGAVDDSRRLCTFVYRNLATITRIVPTMDTHRAFQIFHGLFLVDESGAPPRPHTVVTVDDVAAGRWRFNPAASESVGLTVAEGEAHLEHYTRTLAERGKYALTIWPYHAMLGGIGHALVSAVEEAVFFHTVARMTQPLFHVKGESFLTEHYSVLGPEVDTDVAGSSLATPGQDLVPLLRAFDMVIIAGQAKSHCVAWTIADLLDEAQAIDPEMVRRVYLLEDCTSPVVIPGVVDFSEQADEAFARFARAGMHVVRSTQPLAEWPGVAALAADRRAGS